MATTRKILIRPGIYHPPQGELVASRQRIRGWVDSFQRMTAQGLRIPVCWGHQPEAVPGDASERARQQYYLSAFNAGYVGSLDTDENGDLVGTLDVPSCEVDSAGNLTHWQRLPDGREVKGAVGEVSIALKDFKDGQRREWPDSIIHVALTPLPVVDSQTGFKALGLGTCDDPVYLSLAHLLSSAEGDMPEEKKEDKEKKPDSKPAEPAEGEGTKDHFSEALEVLRNHGLALPEDTTAANVFERLCVAGSVLEGVDTGEPEPAAEPEEEGASYSGEDEGQATEEPRPVMMSLSTAKDPGMKKMLERQEKEHKQKLGDRITALVRRGLKPTRAAELRAKVEGYTLSLDGEMEVVPKKVDYALSLLEDSLPNKAFQKHLQSRVRVEPRPDTRTDNRAAQEEAGDELAALAGAPVRKK